MKTKIAAAVAALAIGVTALATSPAEAHHPHSRFGPLGFVTGAVIGATIANDGYYGCYWEPRYDRHGNYIRSVKICS